MLPLQMQLTQYITSGRKDKQEWFGRASTAYAVMKNKLSKINRAIDKLKSRRKALLKEQRESRERKKNELFYKKLKELMPEEELLAFLAECEDKLAEASDLSDTEG